jgi:peptide/nickel transport system permease protein
MSNAYLHYAVKRLIQALVVILLAYVFTFVVVSVLPGDPITNVLRDPQNGFTEDEIREIITAQGLDQPILVQLWTSLSHFTGDLGMSMRSSRPVTTLIAEVLPSTLVLASAGFAVALVLAMTIAYGTQFLSKRYGQGLLRGFPSLFLSVPNFVIGLVLIHTFGFQLGLFRVIVPNSFWATFFLFGCAYRVLRRRIFATSKVIPAKSAITPAAITPLYPLARPVAVKSAPRTTNAKPANFFTRNVP